MLRIIAQYLLPLLLPFLIYAVYVFLIRGHTPGWLSRAPWVLLSSIGLALAAVSLITWSMLTGAPTGETYVPPHWEDGKIVPSETRQREPGAEPATPPPPEPPPWQ